MKVQRWLRLKMLKIMRLKGNPDLIAKGIAVGCSLFCCPCFDYCFSGTKKEKYFRR